MAFALKIREFNPGICFICRTNIADAESYCHYECAVAYSEEKQRRIDEANKN